MDLKRNIGIILMMLGVLLTVNQSGENHDFLMNLKEVLQMYWPLILSFIGIYLISMPKRKR